MHIDIDELKHKSAKRMTNIFLNVHIVLHVYGSRHVSALVRGLVFDQIRLSRSVKERRSSHGNVVV